MKLVNIHRSGRSQSIRLPEGCRFKGKRVVVKRVGEMVIIFPPDKGWDLMESSLDHFTDDFMADRRQPKTQQRRRGL